MKSIEVLYEMLKDNRYFQYFAIKAQYERRDMPKDELMKHFKAENQRLRPYMTPYENPFMSIPSYEERMFFMFKAGDRIIVQEKIDGSNSHIRVQGGSFTCYGNRYELNEQNHLQGYWYWCRDHYSQIPEKYAGLDIYGEWLVPHHCIYPADKYGDFVVYDVMENGMYWTQDKVKALAEACGFSYIPVLYEGEFKSWAHLMTFVGSTKMGGSKGEGIVVKNQTTLNTRKQEFYIKIVDEEFQETAKRRDIKTVDMNSVVRYEKELMLSESIVTIARVRKVILKMVDNNELSADWGSFDVRDINKIVKPYVYKDCVKEQSDVVDEIGKGFGRYCDRLVKDAIQKLKRDQNPARSENNE